MKLTLKNKESERLNKLRSDQKNKTLEHNKPFQKDKQKKIKAAAAWLKQFPAFQCCEPLEIGIHKALNKIRIESECDFGYNHLSAAIWRHTQSKKYQENINNERIGLYGNKKPLTE